MDDHARHCVIDGPADVKDERTEELMAAVARLMRRG
jgi:CsoR family transcriptional regulator, copper-sensing transcriptional repressor